MKKYWKLIFKDLGNISNEGCVDLTFSPKFIINFGDSAEENGYFKSEFMILGRNSDKEFKQDVIQIFH
jgi:hypothetical protein